MANPEHLAILEQGVEVWNQWRKENPDIQPKLRRADFQGADLRGADLHKADLSKAKLNGTELHAIDLSEADLTETNLWGANLTRADLHGANLTGANLLFAKLIEADMSGTDLSVACLHFADLSQSNLSEADLESTDLNGANLTGVNLGNSELYKTFLRATILHNVNLTDAKCGGTIFAFIDLSTAKGLNTIHHIGRSSIDTDTLFVSNNLPEIFLRGCGVPETLIASLASFRQPAIDCYSFFIHHSDADKEFAQRLHDRLQEFGIRCWLKKEYFRLNYPITIRPDEEFIHWDKTILCCSQRALEEKWWIEFHLKKASTKEADFARQRGQQMRETILIDVDGYLLEKYSGEYKSEILSRSVANFKGWETDNAIFEREVERVIAALRTDEGREQPPTSKL